MRHRICNGIGLGSGDPVILSNNGSLRKCSFWDDFLNDAIKNFKTIANYNGFDFYIDKKRFCFGIEPSYQYDDLQVICFCFADKNECSLEQGRAWGIYGTHIVTKKVLYKDYKRKSKFVKFIDKWFELIKKELSEADENENL